MVNPMRTLFILAIVLLSRPVGAQAPSLGSYDPDLCINKTGHIGLCAKVGGRSIFVSSLPEGRNISADLKVPPGKGPAFDALTAGNESILCVVEQRCGDYKRAEIYYREAVKLNPDFSQAWNNLGYVLVDDKRYEEALAAFEEAVRAMPNYQIAQENLLWLNQRNKLEQ